MLSILLDVCFGFNVSLTSEVISHLSLCYSLRFPCLGDVRPSSCPRSPNLCSEAVVDCVGKPRILIQCSCLIAPPRGHESALWRTQMLLPNAGRKIADWILRGFILYANIHVRIARSIAASVHKFGGCGYDDGLNRLQHKARQQSLFSETTNYIIYSISYTHAHTYSHTHS